MKKLTQRREAEKMRETYVILLDSSFAAQCRSIFFAPLRLCVVLFFLLLIIPALTAAAPPDNPILDELLTKGITIPGGPPVKLTLPLLTEGMNVAARKAALDKAAGRLPLNLFLKNSVNSPFTLKIDSVTDAKGERRGQTVDLYFIAYGKLSAVAEKDALNSLLLNERKQGGSEPVEFLTATQLGDARSSCCRRRAWKIATLC